MKTCLQLSRNWLWSTLYVTLCLSISNLGHTEGVVHAPVSKGTVEKGKLLIPLYRGAAVPFELTVIETPCECDNQLWLYIAWNKAENWVEVQLTGEAALEPYPDVDRTLGVNFYPNPFWPEPEDIVNGRYQLWFIGGAGPLSTFFYDPGTGDLVGSEYDFETPPIGLIPIQFPTLYLFATPLFQPDANGDVNLHWTFPYDAATRGDRPEFAHHIVTFPPPNLGVVNPFRLDQSTLRPYITEPFAASDARPWSDYLRGGLLFDVTVEPAEYFTEPPLTNLTATYSGGTAIAGGIPKGWMFDIDAAFMNVGPPIKPFAGAGQCEPFYEFHGNPPVIEASVSEASVSDNSPIEFPSLSQHWVCPEIEITGGDAYNLHLEDTVRFHPIQPGSDTVQGRMAFGVTEDLLTEDPTNALFEGPSAPYGDVVVSNGRTCFTCHRGLDHGFGLPQPPLSDTVPLADTLFTGIDADTGGDPHGFENLNNHGLIKIRPNRFDPRKLEDDPFKQVFGWRKSPTLWNIGLTQGFLTDQRGRVMFETSRGAIFSHTQDTDNRFDDLFALTVGNDMEAFMFGIFSDPVLEILRDPSHPDYRRLISDPYRTVRVQTSIQKRGQKVFDKYCFSCHNTPQVFSNLSNVEPLGNGDRSPDFPSFAPSVGRTFNIGVSERNRHNLRFTRYVAGEGFEPIIIPLAKENGEVVMHEVTFDIGLAATTGRVDDIGRFKVPQLRNLKDNAPYFHDNSATTLKEVINYFTSDAYNKSRDGQHFPIKLNDNQKEALLEFLKLL